MKRALLAIAVAAAAFGVSAPRASAEGAVMKPVEFTFEGPFGRYDRAALQRGLAVYVEVCSACHSMKLLSYRNLGEPGGPLAAHEIKNEETGEVSYAYGPDEHGRVMNANDNPYVKALAANYEVAEIDKQTGDELTRPARPSDKFHSPFPNDGAARGANGGAVPPDFSVLARARHGGATYIYNFLLGFPEEPPAGLEVTPGKYYNTIIHGDVSGFWKGDPRHVPPGGFVSMAPQLPADRVTYADGVKATPEQMAKDVATFMAWASDPKLEQRKSLGAQVMAYLLLLSILVYIAYRQVWKDVKH